MFKFLRKKRTIKILLWILAIVVIVAFVLWGAPGRFEEKDGQQPKYAGEAFGKKIPFNDFVEAYQATYIQGLMLYGQDFQKYIQFMNLEEDAWNRLILLQVAQKDNIKVTDEEVIEKIKSFPFFNKNDKFDLETYELVVENFFKTTKRKFEGLMRESLIIEKLMQKSLAEVIITEQELKNAYAKENDTAIVSYILIKEEDIEEAIEINEGKIEKFYQENKKDFMKPQQVNVKYIAIDFNNQKEKIQLTDEEIKNYYTDNKQQFKINAEEELAETDTVEYREFEEVKEEIKQIILNTKAGEVALELAYDVSDFLYEDKTLQEAAEKFFLTLGETGYFSANESIPEVGWSYQFLTAAFALEKGQMSDIVQTPKGFYILELINKREPYIPESKAIKDKIEEAFIQKETRQKAKEKAQTILKAIKEEKEKENLDFTLIVKNLGLIKNTTESFKRNSYIPNIGQSKEFTQAAFNLNVGQISEITEVPRGYAILHLDNKEAFDEEKFNLEKENFKNILVTKKEQGRYLEWLKGLKEKANLKSYLSSSRQ